MNIMSKSKVRSMLLVSALTLAGIAQAQNVIVRTPDNASELRANIELSMRAAAAGQSVGMVTGRVNPGQERMGRTGVVGLELDASTLMYSVARIGADGKLVRVCLAGTEAAQRALTAPEFAKRITLASKE